jgi:hypothetical protein
MAMIRLMRVKRESLDDDDRRRLAPNAAGFEAATLVALSRWLG